MRSGIIAKDRQFSCRAFPDGQMIRFGIMAYVMGQYEKALRGLLIAVLGSCIPLGDRGRAGLADGSAC